MKIERFRGWWRGISYLSFASCGLCAVASLWNLYLLGTEPGVRTDSRAKTGALLVLASLVSIGVGAILRTWTRRDEEA